MGAWRNGDTTMPLDMPPQPAAYHIERAAPVQEQTAFSAIVAASRAVSERFRISSEPAPAERMLPQIDPKSPALTQADRVALVSAMRANWRGDLAQGSGARPSSYVGDRIAVAVAFAGAREPMSRGELDSSAAHAISCRMVGVALDRRAGAYLKGGEAAAEAARRSISPEKLAGCREAVRSAQARNAPPRPVARVIPSASIDPTVTTRVRLDLQVRPRVRIDPVSNRVAPIKVSAIAASQDRARGL